MDNENQVVEFMTDLSQKIGETSTNLSSLDAGSKERLNEAEIYKHQTTALLEHDKICIEAEQRQNNLEFEKYKFDEELKLKKEMELLKLEVDKSKAKTEKITMWAKVGVAAAEMGSGIALGILYLKANLKYGGMVGKDGKKWFDDIRHIKL